MSDALVALLLREIKALAANMSPWITTPEMMARYDCTAQTLGKMERRGANHAGPQVRHPDTEPDQPTQGLEDAFTLLPRVVGRDCGTAMTNGLKARCRTAGEGGT